MLFLQVFLGLHDAGDKRWATNRSVAQIVLHPDFQPDSYDSDIALVRLSQKVELTELVQPVCLPRLQRRVSAAAAETGPMLRSYGTLQ